MKRLLKRMLPASLLSWYHFFLAFLAALIYAFPSRHLIVIGVTGTNGKSTVVNMSARILEAAGFKVGHTSTVNFKIGRTEWLNDTKMTMRGRLSLQSFLRRMVREKCQYAIVETTSEGIKQYRHWGIYYDVAVFTNLTPEHIESHGSFEKYKEAKGKLFKSINHQYKPEATKTAIVNLDDPNADYFLSFPAQKKYGFTTKSLPPEKKEVNIISGSNISEDKNGVAFTTEGNSVKLKLLGRFNAINALAAICVGLSQNIPLKKMISALHDLPGVPGRMQPIDEGQSFKIIVDYAHEPAGLELVYQALKSFQPRKIISVLGSQGGGRDKRKRPILGELASRYTDYIILTNEDPYDDDPMEIINEVGQGIIRNNSKIEGQHYFKILDREEALKKAIKLAAPGDIVIVTGKGSEQNMVIRNGKKIPWNDEKTIRNLLKSLK